MAAALPLLTAGGATASLGTGLTLGTTLGAGTGIFSAATPAIAGLTSLAPTAAAVTPGIFSAASPALAGLSSLAPAATQVAPGIFSAASPALAGLPSAAAPGLKSLAMANAPLPTLANGAYNPAFGEMLGKQFAANSFRAGLPDVAKTMVASTDKISPLAFKPPPPSVDLKFLNTFQEGAAIPGVTSGTTVPTAAYPTGYSLPPQALGNMVGGPAIPKVTSQIPVSATPTALAPPSIPPTVDPSKGFLSNAISLFKNPSMQGAVDYIETHPYASAGAAYGLYSLLKPGYKEPKTTKSLIRPYEFEQTQRPEAYAVSPITNTSERNYFDTQYTALSPYEAPGPEYKKAAEGGVMGLAVGGPVETMAAMNSVGANTGYPMAGINTPMYSNPMIQRPEAVNVISPSGDAGVGAYSGEPKFAGGGLSDLGGYSDGGRLLKGPGNGTSDSIPAIIGEKQPARLAEGEFVIPARIVSELGNGSTEAGAKQLYAMMDRIQKARRKTVGKNKVAFDAKARNELPA